MAGPSHVPSDSRAPALSGRASSAPVELSLDLRAVPPDKVLSRVLGALERVSEDVTLLVQVRDSPDYAATLSTVFGALRQRGYWSDSSRFPAGVQRLKIVRRVFSRASPPAGDETAIEPASSGVYATPPVDSLPENGAVSPGTKADFASDGVPPSVQVSEESHQSPQGAQRGDAWHTPAGPSTTAPQNGST